MKELIDSTDEVFEFPMSDRDPLDRWSFGRVTLLGDAAHAMYPIGSNGVSQAIIDAETLAEHLASNCFDIPAALTAYEQDRLPPTTKIIMANRGNGPDHVLQLAEERAPDGFTSVYDVISQEELDDVGQVYKKIAGFEQETVNEKARRTAVVANELSSKGPKE